MGICDAMASIVDINWTVKQRWPITLSATDSATNEKRHGGLVLRWEDIRTSPVEWLDRQPFSA
jgi:hypothetical protein